MGRFTADPILTTPGANPNIDGAVLSTEVEPEAWAANLGDPHFCITVEWSWPTDEWWSHCRVVRSIRSPARRCEEGQVMAEHGRDWPYYNPVSQRPCYTDVQPPVREWTFYTLFFLDSNRVWTYAGSAGEIGPGDFDWTLRLPELLPGAAVSNAVGVGHPADQSNDLVTFLQAPGIYMDMAVTMGETAQYFWNPLRCPPHGLPHLCASWGYRYDESLGLGRTREVLEALKQPYQGSLPAIQQLVDAAIGTHSVVRISNNLMLDINDSSFESGVITDQSWGPLRVNAADDDSTTLDIEDHAGTIGQTKLPPNVSYNYYLRIPSGRTIRCAYQTEYDENGNIVPELGSPPALGSGDPYPKRTLDPVNRGIPIQDWKVVRMGCYAKILSGSSNLTMSMDIYDPNGALIQNIPVLATRALTTDWEWYGNGDGRGTEINNDASKKYCVPITLSQPEQLPANVLTTSSNWLSGSAPIYSVPQSTAPTNVTTPATGMKMTWSTGSLSPDTGIAAWIVPSTKYTGPAIVVGATYTVSMSVSARAGAAEWRPVIAGKAAAEYYVTPTDSDGAGVTWDSSFEWLADTTAPSVGIEVRKGASWATVGTHIVTAFSFKRTYVEHAYGVPVLTVTGASDIDLIVVDDG